MTFRHLLTLTLFLTLVLSLHGQVQIGPSIEGLAAEDRFGEVLNLSADGTTLAAAGYRIAPNGGAGVPVRVFAWSNEEWVQRGGDIGWDNIMRWSKLSLSANGQRLAIGTSETGFSRGSVRVFEWKNNAWTFMPPVLEGSMDDELFTAPLLSADGNLLVVGAGGLHTISDVFSGQVSTYLWNGNNWTPTGNILMGENPGDRFGTQLALSSDNNRLAVGAWANANNGPYSGQVKIYHWVVNEWQQLGSTIAYGQENDRASSVDISADGNRVVIGASGKSDAAQNAGQVRVYEWNGQDWIQLGNAVNGLGGGDRLGGQVAISSDGNRILASAGSNNPGPGIPEDAGYFQAFQWDGQSWQQFGATVYGEAANDHAKRIAFSNNGQIVAQGAANNNGNGEDAGHVRVFTLDEEPPPYNDTYTTALPISCEQQLMGSIRGASSAEDGLPSCGVIAPAFNTVWYSFQGNGQQALLQACDAGFPIELVVYYEHNGQLVCVAGNENYDCNENGDWSDDGGAAVGFFAENEATYYFMIQLSAVGFTPDFELELNCVAPACATPTNQNCTPSPAIPGQAAPLQNGIAQVGNLSCASWAQQTGDCQEETAAYQDLWYRFSTAADPATRLDILPVDLGAYHVVLYDACAGNEIACLQNPLQEDFLLLNSNTEYYLQIISRTDQSGSFVIKVSEAPPLNDDQANAFNVICGQRWDGRITSATADGINLPDCNQISPGQANVWYRHQGTGQYLSAKVCENDFPSTLSVYYDHNGQLECLVANDNYDCNDNGNWSDDTGSRVDFFTEQGATYYLMIQSNSPQITGDFQLDIDCNPLLCDRPFNQACTSTNALAGEAQFLPLDVNCQTVAGDNNCASWAQQPGNCNNPTYAYQDVWYRFQTGNDPLLHLQVFPNTLGDFSVNIYDDCDGNVQACYSSPVDTDLDWLSPHSSYFVQLISRVDKSGSFDICVAECSSPSTYYEDFDGDGYGNPFSSIDICSTVVPDGMVAVTGDCFDFHVNAHEGMLEICDGVDNNCDGVIDDFCENEVPPMLRIDEGELGQCSGTLFAQSTGSGQWIYLMGPYGGAIAAFKDGEHMGAIEFSFHKDISAGRYWNLDDFGIEDEMVLGRDITISTQHPPSQAISVRLFYTQAEILAFQQEAQQVFLLPDPPPFSSLTVTKAAGQGCSDGSLPAQPNPVPVVANGLTHNGAYLEVEVNSFSRFFVHTNKLVLPVDFVGLQVRILAEHNQIAWQVGQEENLAHYEVERSFDGVRFTSIARVLASNIHQYDFLDEDPVAAAYYRIKAIDWDESFSYSPLAYAVREERTTSLLVYPNPVSQTLQLQSSEAQLVKILNSKGVLQEEFLVEAGTTIIDVDDWPFGVYFVWTSAGLNSSPQSQAVGRPLRLIKGW